LHRAFDAALFGEKGVLADDRPHKMIFELFGGPWWMPLMLRAQAGKLATRVLQRRIGAFPPVTTEMAVTPNNPTALANHEPVARAVEIVACR